MYFAETNTTLIFTIAGAVVGGIVLLALIIGGFGYFIQSFRSGKDQKTNEEAVRQDRVDKTLKDLVDAQEKRYLVLEQDHKDNMKQIGILTGKIEEQTKQQKWFEGIFVAALEKFFKDNPGLAFEIDGKIEQVSKAGKK